MQNGHKILVLLVSTTFCYTRAQDGKTVQSSILDPGQSECVKDVAVGEQKERKFGDITIPANYSKLEIPDVSKTNLTDESLKRFEIEVAVLIRGIGDVDELNEEITLDMDFTAIWMDNVIFAHNRHCLPKVNRTDEEYLKSFRTLDPAFLQYIWKPDLFIENVVTLQRPSIIVKPIKLRFSPEGFVYFSTRLTTTIDCEMEFYYYPADTQKCHIKIRSYSHTVEEIGLQWLTPKGVYIMDRQEHNFDIQVTNMTNYTVVDAMDVLYDDYKETYTILQFTILARRNLSYHMIQTYLPSLFFIVITWLCFLIPVGMVEARIGVAMTTLLTLTSMFSSVRESTPIVSYIKAIDLWMVACIFFVFSTLLEFTILVFMRHSGEIDSDEDAIEHTLNPEGDRLVKDGGGDRKEPPVKLDQGFFVRLRSLRRRATVRVTDKKRRERKRTALWIEQYAFLIFFVTFLVFLSVYWPWLLISSEYFSWEVDKEYNADLD